MSHSRFQTARKLLIFWTFFIGLGAVAGAAAGARGAGTRLARARAGADMGLYLRARRHADSTRSVRTCPFPDLVIFPLDTVSPLEDSEGTRPR